jgi:hypothetical protein
MIKVNIRGTKEAKSNPTSSIDLRRGFTWFEIVSS